MEDVRAANANHATRDFTNPHSHERNEANQEGLAVHVLVATLLYGDRTRLDEGVHAHHDHGQRNDDDPAALDGAASDKTARLLREFEAKNGSVFCRELKGRDTGIVLRSCRGCVEDAAELAEKLFEED